MQNLLNLIGNLYCLTLTIGTPIKRRSLISIIYLVTHFKDFTLVQKLGNIDIFITNGTSAFFKFNPLTVDKNSYLDFKLCLSKIKENLLEKELDNDIHLETYGTTSSNAPKEELEKAKLELHGAEQKSNGDDEIEMT